MSQELDQARTIVEWLGDRVDAAAEHMAERTAEDGRISVAKIDEHQSVLYDLACLASETAAGQRLLDYGVYGEHEAALALAWAADLYAGLVGRMSGRRRHWGLQSGEPGNWSGAVHAAAQAGRDPIFLTGLGERVMADKEAGPRHLPEDLEMVRQTFRRFTEERVAPIAEQVHRQDLDIPGEIIEGLADMGCFALSIPVSYGGLSEGGEDELLNMLVVTEELARGSLGVGSLITRPEIVATAVLRGGTEEQKERWLPQLASGERMCAVAVTEPDCGSDVAAVQTAARREGSHWVLNGVKTWCTFAGAAQLLFVLARTDPDRATGHRGLSLFLLDKPRHSGHAFTMDQPGGGRMVARAIPTLGYRGMHSFEISITDWRVGHRDLIGEEDGIGRGFYLQMQGFANGRLQTAGRALGLMQAALESAVGYAQQRRVFGAPLADYELTKVKIARMAAIIAANRAFAASAARALARGEGQLEASQVKQLACRTAEWVTREAQQLHGGYGYAEEYAVSRLFVDARVLSIFEGTDEVLALRVIARELLARANARR